MKKKGKGTVFAIIAGVLTLAIIGWSVADFAIDYEYYKKSWDSWYLTRNILDTVFHWAPVLLLSIALLLRKKKLAACATACVVVYWLLYAIAYIRYKVDFYSGLLIALAFAALLALLILAINRKKIVKGLWFIPAVLFLGSFVLTIFLFYIPEKWGIPMRLMAMTGLKVAALLFIGLWLMKDISVMETAGEERKAFDPQALDTWKTAGRPDEEVVIIKGVPGKNKLASLLICCGIGLAYFSLVFSVFAFERMSGYMSFGFGYGGWYYWDIVYDYNFARFYFNEFFNFSCLYGYLLILAIAAIIAGLILKGNTEKCEIIVTNKRVYGKLPHRKPADIPMNQIRRVSKCPAKGVGVRADGAISRFLLIDNQEEVIKAISHMMADYEQHPVPPVGPAPQPIPAAPPAGPASQPAPAAPYNEVEILKQYKELLDAGIITQEEFDAKKKQVLGL